MIYNDGRCVQCGGVRVAGSTLCADCIASSALSAGRMTGEKEIVIKELEEKNRKLTLLVERLLDHVMEQSLYSNELRQAMRRAFQEQEGGN